MLTHIPFNQKRSLNRPNGNQVCTSSAWHAGAAVMCSHRADAIRWMPVDGSSCLRMLASQHLENISLAP